MAAQAERFGLRLVADASLSDTVTYDLDAEALAILAAAGDDYVAGAEALAVLRGTRTFRLDLLVRADAPPPAAPDGLRRLHFETAARRVPSEQGDGDASRFDLGESFLVTPDREFVAALDALEAFAPNEMTFADLLEATGLEADLLEQTLGGLVQRAAVKIHSTPQPFTAAPGDRPRTGRLVRNMMDFGEFTINLRHRRFVAADPPARLLLALCNGERTRSELTRIMDGSLEEAVRPDHVDAAIASLARLALFEA
jgi:hypothetical protein